MLYSNTLYRAELYDDHCWPYTDITQVYDTNKDRYPDKKLIVTNGHWCSGILPCAWYKVNGVWLATTTEWNCLGTTWSGNDKPTWKWSNDEGVGDNFLCTIPALVDGVRQQSSLDQQTEGVRRRCNRTWWGFDKGNICTVEVTDTGYTLDGIVDRMTELGIVNGIVLDGGGSSQWYDGETLLPGSDVTQRRLYEYLLLWFDLPAEPKKVPVKIYRVQCGAFYTYANAVKFKDQLIADGYNAFVVSAEIEL